MIRKHSTNLTRAPARPKLPDGPPVFVENVLTYCPSCERWIAHEETHGCVLAPDVRENRNAERARKVTALRAAGVSINDVRSLRRG